jgi:osmotically inducible protein OsmC
MQRKASAVWKGGLKDGKGTVSSTSGVLSNTPYSFTTRFENTPGTNPEELIAAAHAACFSMALSVQLGAANLTPESINTSATLTMEKLEAGWTITAVHLDVVARVPGASADAFNTAAQNAKAGCPVSKVLNAKIYDGREAGIEVVQDCGKGGRFRPPFAVWPLFPPDAVF